MKGNCSKVTLIKCVEFAVIITVNVNMSSYSYVAQASSSGSTVAKCDWILENRPNCHTRFIAFIGTANGYTHTLHIHSAITGLGYLVCFSGASFADPVNP